MKKSISRLWLQFMSFILLTCSVVTTYAQDKGVDVDVNLKKDNEWYQSPVVWVIGGAIFILLLVALLRSGERKSA